ncbi:PAS domain S-box [Candidatus Methanoperedens nitroreducens]|uniref:histidine kinase n=1 Tax=Candidatus Methanoperedens nitratireducens TaxID=1392998 RepID=A0A062V1G0_9EURY|nr:PAS domain S-box protein [Candidatus Methanoperedens nitroreducens]KCZ72921.1 PAS domain S-box [Candidatus Methanoperedens nitroreducens]MDJ1423151.1 PAS domain S-box protein [Candidatus Methanoperedens sp.]
MTKDEVVYSYGDKDKSPSVYQSPYRLLIIMALSIIIFEALVMIFLSLLPPLPLWIEVLIDSALLIALLSPTLYFFLFHPLVMHITERKRAEDALRESEERYRKLVELSPDAIAVHSEGKIVFVNMAGARLLGAADPGQLIGKDIMDIVHPDYHEVVKERVRQMREEGRTVPLIEEKFIRLDGSVIDAEVAAIPFTYQDKSAVQVIIRDITERRRAEERLRLFRNLIDRSNDAIFVDNPETGRILDVNGKACTSLGYTREELLNMRVFDIEAVLPDDFSWKEHVNEVKRKGYVVMEGRHRRRDGTTFPVEVNVSYTVIGKNSYTVAVARDITERKRAEESLRRAYDELEMRVQERTAELARSNAELEQFAYIASHDLQEPLRMISGFTQLLSRRYKGKLDRSADEFIDYIVDGTTRMQRMIEDLLAYSRVGTRGRPFELTNLEDVFDQAVTNLKVAIEENKATVTHDPLPNVMGDATQIIQLFQNLISNGIKFRKEEPPHVHVFARRKENEWVFSVKDNGIGIAPEFFEHLFQLFQRQYTRDEYPGTGIGLAICKKIVERHGGRIWAESEVGRGSTFYFTIPVRNFQQ